MDVGIHGRAHANKTLLFSNCLANLVSQGKDIDIDAINISALLHDCGRKNNGKDPYHSINSAELALKFIDDYKIKCNKELVYTCIVRHHPPPNYNDEFKPIESKIVGDADKLDRFRFINQFAPCNPYFFELKESRSLMDIASRINGHKWRSFNNKN